MAFTYKNILKDVKDYYEKDPLQSRFSALVCGTIGSGKTYALSTARKPVHIDSFDPGGTKCLKPWIDKGEIVVDTSFEAEDPYDPSAWSSWKRKTEERLQVNYFDYFGTYCIDTATKWMGASMNAQLKKANRAGEAPRRNYDYMPVKIDMENYISKLMRLPCDFILNGHFREDEELLAIDNKTGIESKKVQYRFLTIGRAAVTIPLQFDEIYVIETVESHAGYKRFFVTESQGEYIARSRLKSNGKLDRREPADYAALLKKIGLDWRDKPKLEI